MNSNNTNDIIMIDTNESFNKKRSPNTTIVDGSFKIAKITTDDTLIVDEEMLLDASRPYFPPEMWRHIVFSLCWSRNKESTQILDSLAFVNWETYRYVKKIGVMRYQYVCEEIRDHLEVLRKKQNRVLEHHDIQEMISLNVMFESLTRWAFHGRHSMVKMIIEHFPEAQLKDTLFKSAMEQINNGDAILEWGSDKSLRFNYELVLDEPCADPPKDQQELDKRQLLSISVEADLSGYAGLFATCQRECTVTNPSQCQEGCIAYHEFKNKAIEYFESPRGKMQAEDLASDLIHAWLKELFTDFSLYKYVIIDQTKEIHCGEDIHVAYALSLLLGEFFGDYLKANVDMPDVYSHTKIINSTGRYVINDCETEYQLEDENDVGDSGFYPSYYLTIDDIADIWDDYFTDRKEEEKNE